MATPLEEAAIKLINSDPQARLLLQKEVKRLDPQGKVIPTNVLQDVALEERINAAINPLIEENKKLREDLDKKNDIDFHEAQRWVMRRPPYNLSDKQIDDLAEWMEKDGEGNQYKSYETAHKYRVTMSNPVQPGSPGSLLPPGARRSAITGRVIEKEQWRDHMSNKEHALRSGDRKTARDWARQEAAKARDEFRNR